MKLTQKGMRWLKIVHLLFAIAWIGGVMALVCIELGSTPSTPDMAMMSAVDQLIIDEFFLIPGGIGIIVTVLLYGFFTQWGFWKFNWLKVKWVVTILLVVIGAGYMGVLIKENVAFLAKQQSLGDDITQYFVNVQHIATAGIVQLVCFVGLVIISVLNPWKKPKNCVI